MKEFFHGEKLYGDTFSQSEIDQWYRDEEEAYADLGSKDKESYVYSYHALNELHGYSRIKKESLGDILGFGSAYGDELLSVLERADSVSIVDPSEAFSKTKEIKGKACQYVKPSNTGELPFESCKFGLVTCFGVLHHIPNVTKVVQEIYRCVEDGGYVLLREPIISMGDWRFYRGDKITKRERGIPHEIMLKIVRDAGFTVEYQSMCIFPVVAKLAAKFSVIAYNNKFLVILDKILSKFLSWNYRYHRENFFHKIAPSSVFLVIKK